MTVRIVEPGRKRRAFNVRMIGAVGEGAGAAGTSGVGGVAAGGARGVAGLGEGVGVDLPERGSVLPIGKGRVVREGSKVALLSIGTRLAECLKAADDLAADGIKPTVADARFMKPLDTELVLRLARNHEVLITVEENSIGGFGSHVLHLLATSGVLDAGLKVRPLVLPDIFIEHDTPELQYEKCGLNASNIRATALAALGLNAVPAAS